MQTRTIAKVLVLNDEGQLLVLRRSLNDLHRPGGYDFPGGDIEADESIEDGVVREAHEEAGLQLAKRDLKLVYATCKAAFDTEVKQQTNHVWLAFAVRLPDDRPIILSHQHYQYSWLSFVDFLALTDHPAHHTLINYIVTNRIASELGRQAGS